MIVSGTYLVLDVFGVTDFIVMLHFGIHRMRLVVTCEEREKEQWVTRSLHVGVRVRISVGQQYPFTVVKYDYNLIKIKS